MKIVHVNKKYRNKSRETNTTNILERKNSKKTGFQKSRGEIIKPVLTIHVLVPRMATRRVCKQYRWLKGTQHIESRACMNVLIQSKAA